MQPVGYPSDEGVAHLAAALAANSTLKSLDISCECSITDPITSEPWPGTLEHRRWLTRRVLAFAAPRVVCVLLHRQPPPLVTSARLTSPARWQSTRFSRH